MQISNEPLILVLDLEALSLKSAEELLPLLKNHILHIVMGQIRDIEEQERLSRKLCRKFGGIFEANDICVLPRPLSTCQTDWRFLAPRHLAHLIAVTQPTVVLPKNPVDEPIEPDPTQSQKTENQQAPKSNIWRRLVSALQIVVLILLTTALGLNQSQSHQNPRVPAHSMASEYKLNVGPKLTPGISQEGRLESINYKEIRRILQKREICASKPSAKLHETAQTSSPPPTPSAYNCSAAHTTPIGRDSSVRKTCQSNWRPRPKPNENRVGEKGSPRRELRLSLSLCCSKPPRLKSFTAPKPTPRPPD